MIDERLGRTAGAWLRDTDEPAFDPQGIVLGAVAQLPRVPQAKALGLRARLEREVVPVPGTTRLVPDQQIRKGGPSMYPALRFAMAAIVLLATGGLLFAVMQPSTDDGVAPVPATSSASPAPTASIVPSESPRLSTTGTTNDGVFELTVTTPQPTWVAEEPIEVSATFAYVGDKESAPYRGNTVLFEVEQLDGPVDSGYSRDLNCPGDVYSRGQIRSFPLAKSGHFDPQADDAAFWRAWFGDPELRLPAGEYRIIAHGQYARPDCTDGTAVEAAVEVKVVEAPPSATPEASDVPDASSQWSPLAVFTDPTSGPGGDAGLGPGVISIGERCVTFKADRAEVPVALMWADDTVAWRPNDRRIVFTDRQGDVVRVNDGDRLMLGGVTTWPASDSQTPEPGRRWSAGLDERWISEPDPSCPAGLWYVGEIDVRKRATGDMASAVPTALKATKTTGGVRLTMTLDGPLVAGQPARVRTRVTNVGDVPVLWHTSGGMPVAASMPDARWRTGDPPVELPKYGEAGFPAKIDLKNAISCDSGCDRVVLDFEVVRANGRATDGWGSDAMTTTERLAPGDSIVFVHQWDGDARLGYGEAPVGSPPDGAVRLTARTWFTPASGGDSKAIKATVEASVVDGRDDALLHPFEAVDAALEDPTFADMMASRDFNRYDTGYVAYVHEDERWYIGSCGRAEDADVQNWHLAEVDPVTGEVLGYIEGEGDEGCDPSTWPTATGT